VYPATPEYVAEHALAFAEEGAAVIGGCCGTGPAHTAAISSALEGRMSTPAIVVTSTPDETGTPHRPAATPTDLEASLTAGRFVIAVEMEPPRSFDTGTLVAAAETLVAAGADVIDVADSPMAKMRMSAWACQLIQERVGEIRAAISRASETLGCRVIAGAAALASATRSCAWAIR
jgi:homocysteine S-methyltransferase